LSAWFYIFCIALGLVLVFEILALAIVIYSLGNLSAKINRMSAKIEDIEQQFFAGKNKTAHEQFIVVEVASDKELDTEIKRRFADTNRPAAGLPVPDQPV
jgi:hypothetical protein